MNVGAAGTFVIIGRCTQAELRACPRLPLEIPVGECWQVRIVDVSGRFAVALWRRLGRSFVDPTGVVEKNLGVTATTRNWNTMVRIAGILNRLPLT